MRKLKKGRKFQRTSSQRKALLNSLASSLILNGKIKTTEIKGKELSRFVEKKITQAKKNNLAARRLLAKYFSSKVVKKMIDDVAPKYAERKGGYTRIIKLGPRERNGAKMVIVELVK